MALKVPHASELCETIQYYLFVGVADRRAPNKFNVNPPLCFKPKCLTVSRVVVPLSQFPDLVLIASG
jgi:hypothetical protein